MVRWIFLRAEYSIEQKNLLEVKMSYNRTTHQRTWMYDYCIESFQSVRLYILTVQKAANRLQRRGSGWVGRKTLHYTVKKLRCAAVRWASSNNNKTMTLGAFGQLLKAAILVTASSLRLLRTRLPFSALELRQSIRSFLAQRSPIDLTAMAASFSDWGWGRLRACDEVRFCLGENISIDPCWPRKRNDEGKTEKLKDCKQLQLYSAAFS